MLKPSVLWEFKHQEKLSANQCSHRYLQKRDPLSELFHVLDSIGFWKYGRSTWSLNHKTYKGNKEGSGFTDSVKPVEEGAFEGFWKVFRRLGSEGRPLSASDFVNDAKNLMLGRNYFGALGSLGQGQGQGPWGPGQVWGPFPADVPCSDLFSKKGLARKGPSWSQGRGWGRSWKRLC